MNKQHKIKLKELLKKVGQILNQSNLKDMDQQENYIILILIMYLTINYENKTTHVNPGLLMNTLIQKLEEQLKQEFMISEVEAQKENFHILMIYYF